MHTLFLPECLDYQTVPAFMRASEGDLAHPYVLVQCDPLEKIDSAGVAMLLEWSRQAQQNQQVLTFSEIPEKLQKLLKLYGLEELFQLQRI